MSILIFSGTEEHQGSKMIHLANDPSPIPLSYPRETRYNVICYPKKAIIRNRSPRVYVDQNFNESQQHPETNLLEDAYYQFGGSHNYDNWRARELLRITVGGYIESYAQHQRSKYQLPFKVDCNNLLNTFHFDPPTSSALPDSGTIASSDSISSTIGFTNNHPTREPYRVISWHDIFDVKEFETTLSQLGQEILKSHHAPISRSSRQRLDPNNDSNIFVPLFVTDNNIQTPLGISSTVLGKRLHPLESDDIPLFQSDNSQSSPIPADCDPSNSQSTLLTECFPDGSLDLTAISWESLIGHSSGLFNLEFLNTLADQLDSESTLPISHHNFSLSKRLTSLIPLLPPGPNSSQSNIIPLGSVPDFAATYCSLLQEFLVKKEEVGVVQLGLEAGFISLCTEFFDLLEMDFTPLFRSQDIAIEQLGTSIIGQCLYRYILELYNDSKYQDPGHKEIRISAKDIIGHQYNNNYHHDAILVNRSGILHDLNLPHNTSAKITSMAQTYRLILWGMFIYNPLRTFYASWTSRTSTSGSTPIRIILGERPLWTYSNMTRRIKLLNELIDTFICKSTNNLYN